MQKRYIPRKSIGTKIVTGGHTVSNSVGKNYPKKTKPGGSGKRTGPELMH